MGSPSSLSTTGFDSSKFIPPHLKGETELFPYVCSLLDYIIDIHHYEETLKVEDLYDSENLNYDTDYILSYLGGLDWVDIGTTVFTEGRKRTLSMMISNLFELKGTHRGIQYLLHMMGISGRIFEWFEVADLQRNGDPRFPIGEALPPECSFIIEMDIGDRSFVDTEALENDFEELKTILLSFCVTLYEIRWIKIFQDTMEVNKDITSEIDSAKQGGTTLTGYFYEDTEGIEGVPICDNELVVGDRYLPDLPRVGYEVMAIDDTGSPTKTDDNTVHNDGEYGFARITEIIDAEAGGIDTATNLITTDGTKAWTLGEEVELTPYPANTLPTPFFPNVSYYVIYVDGTDIQLATTYANAIAGTEIDITAIGVGDFDITSLKRYANINYDGIPDDIYDAHIGDSTEAEYLADLPRPAGEAYYQTCRRSYLYATIDDGGGVGIEGAILLSDESGAILLTDESGALLTEEDIDELETLNLWHDAP